MPIRSTEERAGLTHPWKRGELVHGRDKEGRKPSVNRLIHSHDRKCPIPREVAFVVRADNAQLNWPVVVRQQGERVRPKAGSAPWTVLKRYRRGLAARVGFELARLRACRVRASVP